MLMNKVEQSNSEQNGDNEQHPIEYYLWNGGCDILSMDSNEFNRIMANLQENYNNASGYNISVESIFH